MTGPAPGLAWWSVRWHTRHMNTKAMVVALAALASTGFGPAALAQNTAASASAKVVVYKSPT